MMLHGMGTGAGVQIVYEKYDFRRSSHASLSYIGTYIINLLRVDTWLKLQFCARSGLTGTFGNSVPHTKP